MSDYIKAFFEASNYILVAAFGSGVAILVKRFLQNKPPGLQSLLDVCLMNVCDAYVIPNLFGNLAYGKMFIFIIAQNHLQKRVRRPCTFFN